ncbi:MAG: hypothetical protein IKX68_05560 [Clostridiales bacterium]|nr:hypothetical protein [Clostridiales bacterium]
MALLYLLISFTVGIVVLELYLIILTAIIADTLIPSGAEFRRLDFLWFRLERNLYAEGDKQGRLAVKRIKFVFAPHLLLDHSKVSRKRFRAMDLVTTITGILLAITVMILSFLKWRSLSDGCYRSVIYGVCAGSFGFGIMLIAALIKAYAKKNAFRDFVAEKIYERHQKGSYREVELPPLTDLTHLDPSEPDKLLYLDMRYRKCSFENDLSGMAMCAMELELLNEAKLLQINRFSRNSNLMDYYAFRQKDPVKAREYYEKSKNEIEDDRDCNGRRKLAYFSYFVLKDPEKAKECIEQGFAALTVEDPMFTEEEKNYERQMLTYLKDLIDQETAEKTL